jgi:hypothetical protein
MMLKDTRKKEKMVEENESSERDWNYFIKM